MVEHISAFEPNFRESWNRFGCGPSPFTIVWFFICKRAGLVSGSSGCETGTDRVYELDDFEFDLVRSTVRPYGGHGEPRRRSKRGDWLNT